MRQYGIVSPMFWTGSSGKKLRENHEAQVLALYLMTGPHAHQTGMYYLPLMYLSHETGIAQKGATKALQTLQADNFSVYDVQCEWIWVREMAAWQIGRLLTENDKRAKGVQQYLASVPERPFKGAFIERYKLDFHLKSAAMTADEQGNGGASKGEISPLQGTSSYQNRSDQDQEQGASREPRDPKPPKASKRVPADFVFPPAVVASLLAELPADFAFDLEEAKWRDHTYKTARSDWTATGKNWMRTARDRGDYARKRRVNGHTPNVVEQPDAPAVLPDGRENPVVYANGVYVREFIVVDGKVGKNINAVQLQ
jgi:hypothetical protein